MTPQELMPAPEGNENGNFPDATAASRDASNASNHDGSALHGILDKLLEHLYYGIHLCI